jgi:hypothetical protein
MSQGQQWQHRHDKLPRCKIGSEELEQKQKKEIDE